MRKFALTGSLALLGALSNAQIRDGDEICVMSDSNSCAVDDLTTSALDSSTVIYPGGDTRCAFDDFSNSSVDFATNATYFFQVFPAPEQSKSKLMLYFQGGGACIDDLTCAFGLQCMYETFSPNAEPLSTGVLNRSNDENLFNDYNIVHLPYCTGDLHIGSHVETIADSSLYALLDMPECLGHNMTLHQVGYNNTKAVLDWAVENYPNPEEIIISGSSAGALGAQALSALVADTWQVEENSIRYSVLGDSYVGVLPSDYTAGKLISYYGTCELDLKVTAKLWDQCEDNNLTVSEMMSYMIEDVPAAQWLFINSMYDQTQRYFYELVHEGILGYPFTNVISGEDFYSNMTAIINVYKSTSEEVSTFYVNGTQHVFLTVNDYYHNATRTPGGELLGDFLKDWLVTNSSLDAAASAGSLSVSGSGSGTAGSSSEESAAVSLNGALSLTMVAMAISMLFQ
uniref:GPI-anchored leucine-rich lipoprotein n=1 Tax=Phytophthora ramorum TaxID=164328 RepID=H3GY62_PHYRM